MHFGIATFSESFSDKLCVDGFGDGFNLAPLKLSENVPMPQLPLGHALRASVTSFVLMVLVMALTLRH